MRNLRANQKPQDISDYEYQLQLCSKKKKEIDLKDYRMKAFLSVRKKILTDIRDESIIQGLILRRKKRRIWDWIIFFRI